MSNKTKGVLCIITSAFSAALMGMFVRLAGDIPTMQKCLFRNLVSLFMAAGLLLASRTKVSLNKGDVKWLFIRATFGTISLLSNFYALDRLMVADANMLNKLSPFFTVIVSVILLKEAIRIPQILCIAAAFVGALFIIKPGGSAMPVFPALIGALGGATAGTAYSIVRLIQKRGVPGPFIVFFFSVFSTVLLLPYALMNLQPMTGLQVVYMLLAGVFVAISQFAITAAYRFAPAREISIYDYSQIIFSTLLGMIFLHQFPDKWSYLGYVIIISASVAMFLYNGKKAKEVDSQSRK